MTYEIAIIGGGAGGVRVAKILSKWSAGLLHNIHMTLIDKNHFHTFYSSLYEVATAHIPEAHGHTPLNFYEIKSTAAFSLEEIFLDDLNVSILHGEVSGIDFKKHKILLKPASTSASLGGNSEPRHYDVLVVGAGSETNYFNIAGLKDNAYPLKTFFDALAVRNAIDEAFANTPKNRAIKIIIGGGGFTGCEFAGELAGFEKKLAKIHGRPKELIELSIVEASGVLLGGANSWIQKNAKTRLVSLGIKIYLNSPIKDVRKNKVVLQNGDEMDFDVLVWTAGVKASGLTGALAGVKLEKSSCLMVDKTLRILPYENVFGVGDMTYCVDEATGKLMPMTASVAIREAKYVAENVKRLIFKKPLINYKPHNAGFIIPLGGKYALFESHGFCMAGFFPWILKNLVALHYFKTLFGWRKAFKIWKAELKIFIRND